MKVLEKLLKNTNLFNKEYINNELHFELEDYFLVKQKRNSKYYECELANAYGNDAILEIFFDKIVLKKNMDDVFQYIVMDDKPIIEKKQIEKRKYGYIVTRTKEYFEKVKGFKNEEILVSIQEEEYALTNKTCQKILGFSYNGTSLLQILNDLTDDSLSKKNNLFDIADYKSSFSSRLDYENVSFNEYTNKTFLNGENVSNLYDYMVGKDQLYKIYYLYKGEDNYYTKDALFRYESGYLYDDTFDLRKKRGINEIEDRLLCSSNKYNEEHKLKNK